VLCTDRLIKNKNHEEEHLNMHNAELQIFTKKIQSQLDKQAGDKEVLWMQKYYENKFRKVEHTFREDVQEVLKRELKY
jgi:predicted transcriptional regulator